VSKFAKFKPVLTTEETSTLLTRLTGEAVSAGTVRELWERCYLTPILCHGTRVVGFDLESVKCLFSNGKASPQAESRIGILSGRYSIFDGVEACLVDGTNGEELFFFIERPSEIESESIKLEFELDDLKSIATDDIETYFYAYEEVRRLADLANNDALPPPAQILRPLQVNFSPSPRFSWPIADRLFGLQTESGEFSLTPFAMAALNEDDSQTRKPLHPSERKSTEQIIATLAAMAKLDLSTPYKADDALRSAAAFHALELPNSPETTVKFLKAAALRAGIC